jgi:energy-coupling factor transporter ATP-binding protein EcfA2
MDKLILENFRTYKNRTEIDFAPITILTGKNNSGKSTILKAILLLSDYLNSDNQLIMSFDGPNGQKHKIDCMTNALTWGSNSESFEVLIEKDGFSFSFIIGNYGIGGLLHAEYIHLESQTKLIIDRLPGNQLSFEVDSAFLDSFNVDTPEKSIHELQMLSRMIRKYQEEGKELEESIAKFQEGEKDYLTIIDQKNQLDKRIDEVKKRLTEINSKSKKVSKSKNHRYQQIYDLGEINGRSLTITSLMKSFLSRYYASEDFKKSYGAIDINRSRFMLMNFVDKLNQVAEFNAHHLGPNRTHQARLYLNQNRNMEINEIMAEYAHKTPPKGSVAFQFLIKWMKEFEIGTDVKVQDIQATASFLEIFNNGRWQNLTDKGFGAGQVLTILMKICNEINVYTFPPYGMQYSVKGSQTIIMVEEPETNLHPYLQSRLAEMFYDAYKQFGIRFILETHSEYLIRKTQAIVNKTNDLEAFKVYYIDGSTGIHEMRYREDGKFMDEFGPGFFDESSNLAFELF